MLNFWNEDANHIIITFLLLLQFTLTQIQKMHNMFKYISILITVCSVICIAWRSLETFFFVMQPYVYWRLRQNLLLIWNNIVFIVER